MTNSNDESTTLTPKLGKPSIPARVYTQGVDPSTYRQRKPDEVKNLAKRLFMQVVKRKDGTLKRRNSYRQIAEIVSKTLAIHLNHTTVAKWANEKSGETIESTPMKGKEPSPGQGGNALQSVDSLIKGRIAKGGSSTSLVPVKRQGGEHSPGEGQRGTQGVSQGTKLPGSTTGEGNDRATSPSVNWHEEFDDRVSRGILDAEKAASVETKLRPGAFDPDDRDALSRAVRTDYANDLEMANQTNEIIRVYVSLSAREMQSNIAEYVKKNPGKAPKACDVMDDVTIRNILALNMKAKERIHKDREAFAPPTDDDVSTLSIDQMRDRIDELRNTLGYAQGVAPPLNEGESSDAPLPGDKPIR